MIVENRTFHLAEGVEDAAFAEADHRVQTEFFYRQPGLVRRTTAKGFDGEWLVATMWDSVDYAEQADAAGASDDAARAWLDLVVAASVEVRRYATLD